MIGSIVGDGGAMGEAISNDQQLETTGIHIAVSAEPILSLGATDLVQRALVGFSTNDS